MPKLYLLLAVLQMDIVDNTIGRYFINKYNLFCALMNLVIALSHTKQKLVQFWVFLFIVKRFEKLF